MRCRLEADFGGGEGLPDKYLGGYVSAADLFPLRRQKPWVQRPFALVFAAASGATGVTFTLFLYHPGEFCLDEIRIKEQQWRS